MDSPHAMTVKVEEHAELTVCRRLVHCIVFIYVFKIFVPCLPFVGANAQGGSQCRNKNMQNIKQFFLKKQAIMTWRRAIG